MANYFDEEDVIKALETLYKTQLDTFIAEVNAEKADAIVLATIESAKYVLEMLDASIKNWTGYWIMYGMVENEAIEGSFDNFIEPVTITVQACTFFNANQKLEKEIVYKLLRYRKAIKRTILKNPDVFQGYSRPLVKSLKPAAFPYDDRKGILSIGIDITASISAN